jgi:hypothetical protein
MHNILNPVFTKLTEEERLYVLFSSKIVQQLIQYMQVCKHCGSFTVTA